MSQDLVSKTSRVARAFERLLLFAAALVPAMVACYLVAFGTGAQVFMNHPVHEAAIGVSMVCSVFIAYVAAQCYAASGERLVRWLTLAFIGETIVYAPHGLFTPLSHDHMALFLIYGPMSRLVMEVLLLAGLFQYQMAPHDREHVARQRWWPWIVGFIAIDLVLGVAALWYAALMPALRLILEYAALLATSVAIINILLRPKASPLMRLYLFSLIGFATASVLFIASAPWNHLWWYAHAVFAAAFLLLSYGILQAYQSTGSFSGVFSQQQLMEYLRNAKLHADEANRLLQQANARLEVLATTDPLTGAANRRRFVEQAEREVERAERSHTGLSILLMDIDHFKAINDESGHECGDLVLKELVACCRTLIRGNDLIGRVGGEEFAILLTDVAADSASTAAQRVCKTIRQIDVHDRQGKRIHVSVSIGVASLGVDGADLPALMRIADQRLYAAKRAGRDRVIAA